MRHKIQLKTCDWECGDGCCSDWGISLIVDSQELHSRVDNQIGDGIRELVKYFGINAEVEDCYDEYPHNKELDCECMYLGCTNDGASCEVGHQKQDKKCRHGVDISQMIIK